MVYGIFAGEYGDNKYGMLTDNADIDITFTMEDLVRSSRKSASSKKYSGFLSTKGDQVLIGELANDLNNSGIDLNDKQAVDNFIENNAQNKRILGRKILVRREAFRLRDK